MTLRVASRAARVFSATNSEVSWKIVRRSECPVVRRDKARLGKVLDGRVPRITYGIPAFLSCVGLDE